MACSPMAIRLEFDGHRCCTQMAIRLGSDGHPSRVRWPSDGDGDTLFSFTLWANPRPWGIFGV
ncbi:MAG: hypothetical protein IKJ42_00715 [Bacteroidaceae bacterium]|nr:hypothetical protein [Bacteroidaceae bacterium]